MSPKEALKEVTLFSGLADEALEALANLAQEVSFAPGETVFREGDASDAFYVICCGRVAITKTKKGEEKVIDHMDEGSFLGEMGVVNDKPRLATAVIEDEATLLKIAAPDLLEFLADYPQVKMKIRSEIMRRHSDTIAKLLDQG